MKLPSPSSFLPQWPRRVVMKGSSRGLPVVVGLTDRSIFYRDKIFALVGSKLWINTNSGATGARFFQECIGSKRWPQALREFEALRAVLVKYAA